MKYPSKDVSKKVVGHKVSEKLSSDDPKEDLSSNEAIASFIEQAFETKGAAHIAHALGVVARAKRMLQIASESGLSREQMYHSLSDTGNPTLKTTLALMNALGLDLTAKLHTS